MTEALAIKQARRYAADWAKAGKPHAHNVVRTTVYELSASWPNYHIASDEAMQGYYRGTPVVYRSERGE